MMGAQDKAYALFGAGHFTHTWILSPARPWTAVSAECKAGSAGAVTCYIYFGLFVGLRGQYGCGFGGMVGVTFRSLAKKRIETGPGCMHP